MTDLLHPDRADDLAAAMERAAKTGYCIDLKPGSFAEMAVGLREFARMKREMLEVMATILADRLS